MSEQSDSQIRVQGEPSATTSKGSKTYEPPTLTKLGSVAKLTGQQLKVSGSADMVGFRPSS